MKKYLILLISLLSLTGCNSSSTSESETVEPFSAALSSNGYTFVEEYPEEEISSFVGDLLDDIPTYNEDYGYSYGYYYYLYESEDGNNFFDLAYRYDVSEEVVDYLTSFGFVVTPSSYLSGSTQTSRDENKKIEIDVYYSSTLDVTYVTWYYYENMMDNTIEGYTYSDTFYDLSDYFVSSSNAPSVSSLSDGCYYLDNVSDNSGLISLIIPSIFIDSISLSSSWSYTSSTDQYTFSDSQTSFTLTMETLYSLYLGSIYSQIDLTLSAKS